MVQQRLRDGREGGERDRRTLGVQHRERSVGVERRHEVDDPAVELAGDRVLREARTDTLRHRAHGRALRDLQGRPVRQPDRNVFRQRFHVLPIPKIWSQKIENAGRPALVSSLVGANGIEPLTSTV